MKEGYCVDDSFFYKNIDIDETAILRHSPELLKILLRDRTTGKNIIWATKTYELLGKEFEAREPIKIKLITEENASLIRPRIEKLKYEQKERTKGKAEVFTPRWIVEKQNNIVDQEFENLELQEYIAKVWLEITCGEAPYMVSRYDSVTGEFIPIQKRVGFIDKKLNRISKEIEDELEWVNYAKTTYQTSFGYEFQGDSLLIARENLLYTFLDYYVSKFDKQPDIQLQKEIAKIISYNIFQMDGLNYTIPYSGNQKVQDESEQLDLFNGLELEKDYRLETQEVNVSAKIKYWKNKRMVEFQGFIEEEKLMKFDVVIGNPPYQDELKGTSDKPIYNEFLDESYKIADKAIFITPGRFLFNAGKTPKKWNEKMLSDAHLKVNYYEQKSSKVFPDTDIKGGVAITYYDSTKDFGAIRTFTQFKELNSIINKVVTNNVNFKDIRAIIYTSNRFNLKILFSEYPNLKKMIGSNGKEKRLTTSIFEKLSIFGEKRKNPNEIEITGLINLKRVNKFINPKFIEETSNLEKNKVILPKSNGSGKFGEKLSSPFVGEPFLGYTQTFISIGSFDSKDDAEHALKYIKTKFARVMLGTIKITQDNNRDAWKNVPIQDFTSQSDINWTKTIPEIDQQLYKKYKLNEEEMSFIETKVKEME